MLLFVGCAPKHAPYSELKDGKVKIYDINRDQALDLAYQGIVQVFPGQPVSEIYKKKGFSITEGALDRQTYTVRLVHLKGISSLNKNIDGFSYDVSSIGSRFAGPYYTKKLLDEMNSLFDRTGKGVWISNARPIMD